MGKLKRLRQETDPAPPQGSPILEIGGERPLMATSPLSEMVFIKAGDWNWWEGDSFGAMAGGTRCCRYGGME
jgi:hypothetical protein